MQTLLQTDDRLFRALIERDPAYDGFAYVGVTTTGVFCRLTCPARKPNRENCRFFSEIELALRAGFRPCERCRPLDSQKTQHPLVTQLVQAIDEHPDAHWQESDLRARGHEPSTVRRTFRQQFGKTFLQYARARRLGLAATKLTQGGSVIEAQLDAGYESGSGFREAFARILGTAPVNVRGNGYLSADWVDTPLGPMIAIADERALHILEFADRKALKREIERLRSRTGHYLREGSAPPIAEIKKELGRYFEGRSVRFATPTAAHGSEFERSVWQELKRIPLGETRSYRDIAVSVERSTAVRAVARANGANPLAIIVPCHRVIGSDGSLTGYGGGLWRKRWLLEHEHRVANSGSQGERCTAA